ncbi:MAG: Tn3 family transposase [Ahniella sp.]|nr:Tn3 family transposase [Ahniella sp.]
MPKGEEHDDYRLHLVSDDVLDRELDAYGETTGIETDPKLLTRQLKQDLADAIKQVDGDFPENPYSRIVNGRLSIKKSPAETPNPAIKKLDLLVKDRLAPINIVDLLVDTCRWTNLHRQFRHLSGGAGRISDLLPPVVAMTFCYGFNLGPAQTERSLRGISRKQLAHLQLHYAKDDHLDAANTTVINAFSRYQLTKFWGTGKTASADGTQWSMHEENLISTNHIRYGGYGGIGYYLVADNYIALMARFITCGAYEATYILDLLMNNVSEVQPDTVHGDTHAQNLPVFAMAFLLGIKLMPRIRQLWRVQFSRAQKQHRCKNLEPLFKDDVNWERIQTHMREMMRVAVSIKLGKLAPSDILRRLGSHSQEKLAVPGLPRTRQSYPNDVLAELRGRREAPPGDPVRNQQIRTVQPLPGMGVLRRRGDHRRERPAPAAEDHQVQPPGCQPGHASQRRSADPRVRGTAARGRRVDAGAIGGILAVSDGTHQSTRRLHVGPQPQATEDER